MLIAYTIALLACVGVARSASGPVAADGPTSGFTPLTTGWSDGAALDDNGPGTPHEVAPYIINGTLAADGEHPWMTFVLVQESVDEFYQCGGTLIAPDIVLTAAHCVDDALNVGVIVGRTSAPSALADPDFVFADEVAIHPDYVSDGAQGDIALLRLEAPVTAPVVQLAHPEDFALSAGGVLATVAGWGITAPNGEPSDLLQTGSMPVRSAVECAAANPSYVDASNVCAGYATGEEFPPTGACQGDSGGPLMVAATDSRTRVQVGTVSYGPASGCAELDKPIVYMRVSFYLAWIESLTGDLVGPPVTTTSTTSTTSTTPTSSSTTPTTVAATTTATTPTTTTPTTTTTTTTTTTSTVVVAAATTTVAAAGFAAPASGSTGGTGGSQTLAATGSSGWLTIEFIAWALVVMVLGRMTLLVARRPAIR